MAVDWSLYEEDVIRLYVNERKTIKETLKYLHEKHGVKISPKQFKSKFGGQKNLRADEWKVLIKEIRKRQAEGKISHVFLNDRKLDQGRVTREIRRYSANCNTRKLVEKTTSIDIAVSSYTQNRIEIRTPSPGRTKLPRINSSGVRRILPESMMFHQGRITGSRPELTDPQLCLDQEFSFFATNFDNTTTQVFDQEFSFSATENRNTMLGMSDIPLGDSQQISPFHCRYPPHLRGSTFFVSSEFRNAMSGQEASSSFFYNSPEIFSFIPEIGAHCTLSLDLQTSLLELAQSQARLFPGKHGWLFSHLIGIDPKLMILKSAAGFVERVLWKLNRELENLDFNQQSLHQMFSIVAYLASNNMLARSQIQNFFRWVILKGLENQLSFIIQTRSISLRACLEAILEAVITIDSLFHSSVQHFLGLFISTHNLDLSNRLGGKLLHSAVQYANVDTAKLLISYGADIDFVFASSQANRRVGTPLCTAVLTLSAAMIQFLISAGCDINRRFSTTSSQTMQTALTIAIERGSVWEVELLLDGGAKVDLDLKIKGHNILEVTKERLPGLYPILLKRLAPENIPQVYQISDAAEEGNRKLSLFLLNHNIVQKETLEDALCHSIRTRNVGAARTLLHRGIDPDARLSRLAHNIIGCTSSIEDNLPILLAAAISDSRKAGEFTYLLMKAGADLNDGILTKICRLTAINGNFTVLRVLAEAGLNINLIGPPLLEGLARDDEEGIYTFGYYLDMGTPINFYGPGGRNGLQAAAEYGNLLQTQYFLDRGADINLLPADDGGRTALQAAVGRGDTKIIDYLIDAGADVKIPPAKRDGVTVLEAAANAYSWSHRSPLDDSDQEIEFESTFKNLLALGAPVNRTDDSSSDLLHRLIGRSRNKCVKLVIQAGAQIEDRATSRGTTTPLQVAAEGNMEATRLLLDLNADINAPPGDEYGRTALQAAASAQNPDFRIVEFLLSSGADVNAKPARKGGVTALQGAAIRGDIQIVRLLLMYGADINAAPALEEGRTPIEGAAEHGRLDMIQLLLSSGAMPDPIKGFSRAIELAKENENFVLADLLREHEKSFPPVFAVLEDSLFRLSSPSMPSQGMVFPGGGF